MRKSTANSRSARAEGASAAGAASSPPRRAETGAEARIVICLILLTLFLAGLPYLLAYAITPPGMQFVGTAYNIDDYCNYLSWLRQMMDGHFFLRSLFTTEPQKGLEFNVFFWLLGRLADTLHLSPQAALQAARVVGGAGLLGLIYRLYRYCLPYQVPARLAAFGFACLGSGFGWIVWAHWHDKNLPGGPVDAWQPEAYTFLSIYTSALMTVSTLLIVGALYSLLLGEQTGRWRYSLIAGLCGAILGNMHSYDVLHLSAAWGLFLVVRTIVRRGRGVAASWLRAIIALGLTLPTTLYEYFVFRQEAVFHQRAEVRTPSPAFWYYILGYGLVFLLALVAALWLFRTRAGAQRDTRSPPEAGSVIPRPLLFAVCWAVAGLAVIYLPLAFQRKMLMGEDVPLCLLAGLGASYLTSRFSSRAQALALVLLVAASVPSNLLFLTRDVDHLENNRSETLEFPYLSDTLIDVFHWIAVNTPPDSAIVGSPQLCAYLPGYADRAVWAGHWAETPHYAEKVAAFVQFSDSRTTDQERLRFLRSTHAQYLLYANNVSGGVVLKDGEIRHFADPVHSPPPFLRPVYSNKDYTLFAISPAS